jgi:ABC-type antimicrobial peptide transport system permease subunit
MGILGLMVAAIGVYGVTSFAASQRTREIGIRMALGAGRRDILVMVLSHGLRLVALGLLAGLAAALAVTRVMARFLVVSPTDVTAYAAAALLLGFIALCACYVPARRAVLLDPISALRHG